MNIKIYIYIILVMSITVIGADAANVTVKNRQILVNGNPFFVKSVGYSPVPIGIDPEFTYPYGDYFIVDNKIIYNRDIPLLKKMGTNTIRLWGWQNNLNHTDFLNRARSNGIYVIVTFWMGPSVYGDISSSGARATIKKNFRDMVKAHKNNSAVLMWAIGNELNAPWMYGNRLNDLFSLINEMALEAHSEEGKNYHPVTTVLADIDIINTITTYNSSTTNLDVWSVDPPVDYNTAHSKTENFDITMYRGRSFGTFFKDYANISRKPLLILEYGIDAYDDKNKTEYEFIGPAYQAIYAKDLWNDIKRNSNITSGGSIMAYSDEWWKGKHGQVRSGCPDYDSSSHSDCGYPINTHPDGYANEEWWGIMRIKDNGTGPDIIQPRAVYNTLKLMWTPPASVTNLKNITYARTYINWTWTDPKDSDFSKVMIYLNGQYKGNVLKGRQFFNATNLKNGTYYKIGTHTVDTYGNINQTWRNHTAKTK